MIGVILITVVVQCSINIINAFPKSDGQSVIAETEQGKLRGRIDFNYWNEPFFTFEAVPYAEPPIGELRFKAPQPPLAWKDGVREAVKPGSPCIQITGEGSEDCLILSIHSKMISEKQISETLRPVMVWIHGGAFKLGSISNDEYGPEFLVHENIVLVKIQYRLNVLGFLSLEDEELGVSGNAGLKDQVMALKWVQKNIENFGGDPNKVTIFGASAGGTSTHLLYLSPMAKGLFNGVISQSSCGLEPWVFSNAIPRQNFFEMIDCNKDDGKDVLNCLREVDAKKLIIIQNDLNAKTKEEFLVVIENSTKEELFLSEKIEKIIKDGNFNQLPFMIGYVPQEAAFLYAFGFVNEIFTNPLTQNYIPRSVNIDLSSDEAKNLNDDIKEMYFKNRKSKQEITEGYLNYLTDYLITERMYVATKLHASQSTAPVYYYEFNYDTSLNLRHKMFPQNYITHGDDLRYLFTNNKTPNNLSRTSIEIQGVKRMIKLWTRFANTGNPNPLEFEDEQFTGNVEWKPVTPEHFYYLIIQPYLELAENPEEERMKYWEAFWQKLKII